MDDLIKVPAEKPRVVVMVVDDARSLLKTNDWDDASWFHIFRESLASAQTEIRCRFGDGAGIFAILVDSDPRIAQDDMTGATHKPPISLFCRTNWCVETKLFRPFVLTQTMDVRFDEMLRAHDWQDHTPLAMLQRLVFADEETAWRHLVLMGRPLWDRLNLYNPDHPEDKLGIMSLGVAHLLGRHASSSGDLFTEESLFGAASVLCRLGLGVHPDTELARRPVADFMGVLAHKTYPHDQHLTCYTSDPVLSIAAANVWHNYSYHHELGTLEERILPGFRKLVGQDVVDTRSVGMGELVGCLILLLAMDTTTMTRLAPTKPRSGYEGDFYSTRSFLQVLHGAGPIRVEDPNSNDLTDAERCNVEAMLESWSDWRVGFSHFVQLSQQPDELLLWSMLSRRAAAVFHREFIDSIDVVIPIFNQDERRVSMIMIRGSASGHDVLYPHSATTATRPSRVFTKCTEAAGTERRRACLHELESDKRRSQSIFSRR